MRTTRLALAGASILIGTALSAVDRPAHAGAATAIAGTDLVPVVAVVDAVSLLGEDTVVLRGWVEVIRYAPRLEGDSEVMDLEIVRLDLVGASQFGIVSVAERSDDGGRYRSGGAVRGLGPGSLFPASSRIDLFLDLSVPASPTGPLLLHNDAAFPLTLEMEGEEHSLSGWPPFDVTFRRADAGSCVPLLDENGLETELGLCVGSFRIDVAPHFASFSVARGGPSLLHPADIYGLAPATAMPGSGQGPYVRISCRGLGLSAEGCDNASGYDDIDALSFGSDAAAGVEAAADFSVASGAHGAPGSAVETQRACPPAEPGLSPEPEPDVFRSYFDGQNAILLDGNGPVGSCQPAFPLGLLEAAASRDDLDALASQDAALVDDNADGVPQAAVYFSLASQSPSLAVFGYTPGDILQSSDGDRPSVYASALDIGLQPGDDLDALCLHDDGDGRYGPRDVLLFSLAQGSPTLDRIGAAPGDLLWPGARPMVMRAASSMGLVDHDDVDATNCSDTLALIIGSGDVDCSGARDSVDAALLLRRVAGLIGSLPCEANADVNGRGIDSVDAALILQFEAGLLDRLPV